MTFQKTVNYDFAFGIPGEIVRSGPHRAHAAMIDTAATAANCVFGRMFTQPAAGGAVVPGGTGMPYGILANPKEFAALGTSAGPLYPVFALNPGTVGDFLTMGLVVLSLTTAATLTGELLQFSQTDGTISVPAVAGTPDTDCTLFNGVVEQYEQTAANGLVLCRLTMV